jgi:hypothetical protein
MEITIIIAAGLILVGSVIIFRLVGAWMFRINEVINTSEETNKILKEISAKLDK